MPGRGPGGGPGVAALLALVEVHDAFQPMVGVERASAGQRGGVALDSQAQLQDGVDPRMSGHQLQQVGDRVPGLASGQVHRIVPAPPWGEHPVDGGQQVVWEAGERQVGVCGDRIGGDDAPSTGRGEHQDAVSPGQWLGGERGRRLECGLDGGRPDHARLSRHAVEHPVVGCQGPGVRRRGPLSVAGGPTLHHHHRHASRYLADPFEEAPPVGQALHVAEPHVGLRVVGEPLQIVGDAGGRDVSGRNGTAQPDAGLAGVVLEGRDEVARLRRHADPAARGKGGHDLGAEADRRRRDPLAVGSGQHQVQLVGQGHQPGLGNGTVRARLRIASGGHEHGPHPPGGSRADDLLVCRDGGADHQEFGAALG